MSKKITKKKELSSSKKTVQEQGYSSENEKIIWRFDKIDRSGKFAFNLDRDDFRHKDFLDKLLSYSTMTWMEIKRQTHDDGESKHHAIKIEKLSNEALERFQARHLEEDSDSIFSIAFDNKWRIIGIRRNQYFDVLWHDPKHEVYPVSLKHT